MTTIIDRPGYAEVVNPLVRRGPGITLTRGVWVP